MGARDGTISSGQPPGATPRILSHRRRDTLARYRSRSLVRETWSRPGRAGPRTACRPASRALHRRRQRTARNPRMGGRGPGAPPLPAPRAPARIDHGRHQHPVRATRRDGFEPEPANRGEPNEGNRRHRRARAAVRIEPPAAVEPGDPRPAGRAARRETVPGGVFCGFAGVFRAALPLLLTHTFTLGLSCGPCRTRIPSCFSWCSQTRPGW